MDIGPCEGDSCPFAQTHGLHDCQAHESCLDTRRITLDSGRDLKVYFHPRGGWQGRGKNRRRVGSVTMMRAGSLEPGWYHELAREAEAADGLTASRPHDWLECKRTRELRCPPVSGQGSNRISPGKGRGNVGGTEKVQSGI